MANKPAPPKTPRTAGAKPAQTKPASGNAAPALVVVGEAETKTRAASGLRLKALVDQVVAATGGKKKGVKEIVEATLAQLGSALHKGESLNLPGFGRLRVARAGAEGGGAMTLKLRQFTGGGAKAKSDKQTLAETEDQD